MKKSPFAFLFLFLSLVPSALADSTKDDDSLLTLPFKTAGGVVDSFFDLGNILVGGKRLDSPLSDFVATSVSSTSVVTSKDIEKRGAKNLPEAMQEVPGVIMSDLSGNGEEPTLDFRGFSQGQDFVFLLDGVRLNEPKSNNINYPLIPLSLMDRLEVSRSGASFLYGEGAMGGVANLVPKKPMEESGLKSRVKTGAGSFGEWSESMEASARQGNSGIFMSGDLYHTDGFRQNSSVEKQDFYIKLDQAFTEENHIGLSYLHADAHLDRSGSIRESRLRDFGYKATERPRNFSDLDTDLIIFNGLVQPWDGLVLSGNVFGRQSHELSVANFATFDTTDNELDLMMNTWGTTVQLEQSKDLPFNLVESFLLGVDYSDNSVDEEDFNRSKATLGRVGTAVDTNSTKENIGFFSKASLAWNERLGTYFGLRYDSIDFTNADAINIGNNTPSEVSQWSHSIGASYKASKQLSFSALYSESFRAPTLSDLYANPLFGGNPNLKPLEAANYEVGAKWISQMWTASSTFFLNHIKNEIGFDPNLTDATHLFGQNSNFGKTRRGGLETSIESRFTRWLRARLSHTYTDARFGSNDNSGTQKSGDFIPMIPRNRWSSSVFIDPTENWSIMLNMLSVSQQVLINDLTNDRNGRRLPAYTVFNVKTAYRLKGWEFSVEVRNLLDERYETGGSLGVAPGPFVTDPTTTDNFFVPAPGRGCYASVSYSF